MTQSNVGNAQVYEAGDQRNAPQSEQDTATRFEEGKSKQGAHNAIDPKDERSIANRLEKASKAEEEDTRTKETKQLQQDATLPARSHGNEPSKGAKIDQQLKEEEEEILKKKGSFGPNV